MFNLSEIISHMGAPAIGVAATLLLMALASLAVFFERMYTFAKSRSVSRQFAGKARTLLGKGQLDELVEAAADKSMRASHLARLMAAGIKAFTAMRARPRTSLPPLEAARREVARQSDVLNADLRRGMNVLASVGSVAPFVGLLGTVLGIITSFQGIAKEGSGGLGAVSLGIAEALYETALGLVVAIPAVLVFNWLSAQADSLMLALDQARGEFIDELEAGGGEASGRNHTDRAGTFEEPVLEASEIAGAVTNGG
jgi:biopolymer transport protein ExbB